MGKIEWQNKWCLGIEEIDNQHRTLIEMINTFYNNADTLEDITLTKKHINELLEYIRLHFMTEERYMIREEYPYIDEHRQKHIEITGKALQFRTRLISSQNIDKHNTMKLLYEGMVTHFEEEDQKFGKFLHNDLKKTSNSALQ